MVEKYKNIDELIEDCPKNKIICDNMIRAWSKINSPLYDKIVCSISGGSDSDVMLDICYRCDKDKKIEYVWFDTGLEYQATKEHLKKLCTIYGIDINVYKAIKPIPLSCKVCGQPFLSKQVSEMISRLQKHEFDWKDGTFDELYKKYPHCKVALRWWCNDFRTETGKVSKFNISYNKWLKEFIIQNPPNIKISNKCCYYAKKKIIHNLLNDGEFDLNIMGVRKSEGGSRSSAYKTCFDDSGDGYDNYRPLFWYRGHDKKDYEEKYNIEHSRCYTEYGLKRTGCCGCPFGRDFEYELEVIQKYEPKLFAAVSNIFGGSYEYTRKYREFCEKMNRENRSKND